MASSKLKRALASRPPDEIHIIRSRTKGGRNFVHRIKAQSFEIAKELAIEKFKHIIYFKPKPMDLQTALERAKKASLDSKGTYYVIYDSDMECSVGRAPLKGAAHKFTNGVEDKSYKPKVEETAVPSKTIAKSIPAQSDKAKKIISAKSAKEAAVETASAKSNSKSNKMEKSAKVKKSAKKYTKKGGRVAIKHTPKPEWGKKVDISIADMLKGMKKGFRYRDPQGVFQTEKGLKARANQEYVREGMFVSKAEK